MFSLLWLFCWFVQSTGQPLAGNKKLSLVYLFTSHYRSSKHSRGLFHKDLGCYDVWSMLKLQPFASCARHKHLWWALTFLPLLTSSVLTKTGITHTQLLQGGKDLSNNNQIRVISLMGLRCAQKMLKKLSEKLRAKFPATKHGYSMVKIAHLNDALWEVFFYLQASPVEGHSLQQKEKKRRKRKGRKKKSKITFSSKIKTFSKFWFLRMPEHA